MLMPPAKAPGKSFAILTGSVGGGLGGRGGFCQSVGCRSLRDDPAPPTVLELQAPLTTSYELEPIGNQRGLLDSGSLKQTKRATSPQTKTNCVSRDTRIQNYDPVGKGLSFANHQADHTRHFLD